MLSNNYMEMKDRIESERTGIEDPKNQSLLTLISMKNEVQRSPIEIEFMKECCKHNQFFQFIHSYAKKKSLLDTIYRKLQVRELNPGELLFKHGEPSNEFFVILHGSVLVMLPRQMDKQVPTSYFFLNAEATKKIHNAYEEYVVVNRIQKGETFGEVGLIHKVARTATIVAPPKVCEELTSCVLASFDYDSFINLIQPLLAMKMKHKIEILKQVPDFKNLSKRQISIFCSACMEMNYRMGQTLYEEGSSGSFYYILVSGVIEFYKTCNGKQIGLYQSQHIQLIGQLLDENQNHYLGARVVSDYLHFYKINRTVLTTQMERWGQEIQSQRTKLVWVADLFSKQMQLSEKKKKEIEKLEDAQKTQTKRVLTISSPLNRNSYLHISSKKYKESGESQKSTTKDKSVNQQQNYFLRYQIKQPQKTVMTFEGNKELESKKEKLYQQLKDFSEPLINVNNTQQSLLRGQSQQKVDQTSSQIGKSLYDKVSSIFGSENEGELNRSEKEIKLIKARVQSAIQKKVKLNKRGSVQQMQNIEQLVKKQQKRLSVNQIERKPYKGRPKSHLQAMFC